MKRIITAVLAAVLASLALASPARAQYVEDLPGSYKAGSYCVRGWASRYRLEGGNWPAAKGKPRGHWVRKGRGFWDPACPF